jgi:hypothetical protein
LVTDRGGERVVRDVAMRSMRGHVLRCEVRGLREIFLLRRGTGEAIGRTGQRYARENGPSAGCPVEGLIGYCVSLLLSDSYTMLDFLAMPNERLLLKFSIT